MNTHIQGNTAALLTELAVRLRRERELSRAIERRYLTGTEANHGSMRRHDVHMSLALALNEPLTSWFRRRCNLALQRLGCTLGISGGTPMFRGIKPIPETQKGSNPDGSEPQNDESPNP